MAKRGRPRKNGVQEGWVLFRASVALEGYNRSRKAGEKHSEALKAGVAAVRQTFPGMPISLTEVKRILAEFQPKAQALALRVAEPESNDIMTLFGRRWKKISVFGIGPLPTYPRHNASTG
jgi:hypothetical protein